MEDAIDRVYRTLVPKVERFPRSPVGSKRLPKLIAFPDTPSGHRKSTDHRDVELNDGLHYHGIILVNADSRLKVRLDMHIKEHYKHYVRPGGPLRRIHIEPLEPSTAGRAVGYGMKALEWRIPDTDRIFIRPRTLSELPDDKRRQGAGLGIGAL
jgi:hypothetical protein